MAVVAFSGCREGKLRFKIVQSLKSSRDAVDEIDLFDRAFGLRCGSDEGVGRRWLFFAADKQPSVLLDGWDISADGHVFWNGLVDPPWPPNPPLEDVITTVKAGVSRCPTQ